MSDILDEIDIVPATPADAEACSRIHAQSFRTAWDTANVARLINAEAATTLVAVTGPDHKVIGFILAFSAVDEAEILTLAVDPAWRRLGIGQRLVKTLAESLEGLGVTDLFLEVAVSNEAARQLYRSARFVEAGRRKDYYAEADGDPEDALILRLTLD